MRSSSIAIALLVLSSSGCDDDSGMTPPPAVLDLSVPVAPAPPDLAPPCLAGAKSCVTDHLARLCPPDQSGWLPVQCDDTETCMDGDCVAAPLRCTAADNGCLANTAFRCMDNGMGFTSTACPDNTTCVGPGLCQGSCVLGSSRCLDSGTVATCTDGNSLVLTQCNTPALELCVTTQSSPVSQAACKASACAPAATDCALGCGDPVHPAADQTASLARCDETPSGYQWTVLACPSPTSCNPTAGTCSGGTQAACASECTPSQQRCSADQLGVQLCDATGHWAGVTSCNADPTQAARRCRIDPVHPLQAQCAVPLCALGFAGTCDSGGQLIACTNAGTLGAAAPCATGRCVALAHAPVGGLQPGACVTACQLGDGRCAADGTQSCLPDGTWSTTTVCTGGVHCLAFTQSTGRPGAVCGVCQPGRHRCTTASGTTDGGVQDSGVSTEDAIETCGSDGNWAAPVACAGGLGCRVDDATGEAACTADCIPGAPVCVGARSLTGIPFTGGDAVGTCTSDGRLPPDPCGQPGADAGVGACCAPDRLCRTSAAGGVLGCAVCVPDNNERGLTDSRCTDVNGSASAGPQRSVETCQGASAAVATWSAAVACGNDVDGAPVDCQGPTPPEVFIPTRSDVYCHSEDGILLSESSIRLVTDGEEGCTNFNATGTVACPGADGTPVPDCCDNACAVDIAPGPAYCGAPRQLPIWLSP